MTAITIPDYDDDHMLRAYELCSQIRSEFESQGWDTYYVSQATIEDKIFLLTSVDIFHDYGNFSCESGGFTSNNWTATKAKFERLCGSFIACQPSTGLEILVTMQKYENEDALGHFHYAAILCSRELPSGSWAAKSLFAAFGYYESGGTLTIDCSGPITTSCDKAASLIYSGSPDVDMTIGSVNLAEPGWTDTRTSHEIIINPVSILRKVTIPGPYPAPGIVYLPPGKASITPDLAGMSTVSVEADYYVSQDVVCDVEGGVPTTCTLVGDGTSLWDINVLNVPAGVMVQFLDGDSLIFGQLPSPYTSTTSTVSVAVPDGTYTVSILKEGYATLDVPVTVSGGSEGIDFESLTLVEATTTSGAQGDQDVEIGGVDPATNMLAFKCISPEGYVQPDYLKIYTLDQSAIFSSNKTPINFNEAVEFDPESVDLVIIYERDSAIDYSTVKRYTAEDFTGGVRNIWEDVLSMMTAHNLMYYNFDYDSAYATEDFYLNDIDRLIGTDKIGKGPGFIMVSNTADTQDLEIVGGLRTKELCVNVAQLDSGDIINLNAHLGHIFPSVEETGDIPEGATTPSGGDDTKIDWKIVAAAAGIGFFLGLG